MRKGGETMGWSKLWEGIEHEGQRESQGDMEEWKVSVRRTSFHLLRGSDVCVRHCVLVDPQELPVANQLSTPPPAGRNRKQLNIQCDKLSIAGQCHAMPSCARWLTNTF